MSTAAPPTPEALAVPPTVPWRRLDTLPRAALLIAVALVAVGGSLLITLANAAQPLVAVPVVLPPLLALVLACVIHQHHPREPQIHDRHTDLMVAFTGLALGVALPALLQQRFDDLRWLVRLDLVGLPLIVAGLLALLFGARAVWRQRAALTLVAAIGPLLALAAIAGGAGLAAGCLGLVALTAVLVVRRRRLPPAGPVHLPAFGRSWVLLAATLVAGPTVAATGGRLDLPSTPSPGPARVAAATPVGWAVARDAAVDPPTPYRDLRWRRAVLRGPDLDPAATGVRQAIVDRIRSGSRLRLAALPISALYDLNGRRAPGGGDVRLPRGVRGRLLAWQNPTTRLTFTFVDFVLDPDGGDPERVLVAVTDERRFDPGVFPQPAARALPALGTGLSALLRGTPDELVAGRILPPKNAAVALDLARRIIRSTVG